MKKTFVALMLVGILVIASCSKNNSSPNSWTFRGATYTAATSTFTGNTLNAVYDSASTYTTGTLSFAFAGVPTTSGSYKIIGHSVVPNGNQVSISLNPSSSFPSTYYYSTGHDNIYATVTVSNSIVTISVPKVWLLSSITGTDSSQLTAAITQTL